jgi:hypothetical protein
VASSLLIMLLRAEGNKKNGPVKVDGYAGAGLTCFYTEVEHPEAQEHDDEASREDG